MRGVDEVFPGVSDEPSVVVVGCMVDKQTKVVIACRVRICVEKLE